jgi:molecular chaperone HtpG
MEKYFKAMQGRGETMMGDMRAKRVLELNASHPAFDALKEAFAGDKDKAAKYAQVLYAQAQLTAGVPLDDPAGFSELLSGLLFEN